MSRYWNLQTRLDDNTNMMGNADLLDYEEYGQIAILLNHYVRKEEGKGLSTNDFTDEYRAKLDGIEDNAQVNVLETISVNEGTPIHADENKNVDIFVPTKTSEIENDSDFAVTSEDTTFTEDFNVLGDTSLKDTNIDGNLTVSGSTTIEEDYTIGGDETVNGDLIVLGDTSLKDTQVDGDLTVNDNVSVSDSLTVSNDTTTDTLKVETKIETPNIYNGIPLSSQDLEDLNDGTLYIPSDVNNQGTLNRKTTKNNVTQVLPLVPYQEVSTTQTPIPNTNPLVYDSITDSVKKAVGNVTIPSLTVNGNTTLHNSEIDGSAVISGNTTVHGDLYVDGVTHTTTEEQINTSSDTIVLRQNNPTSLGSTYAGIIVNKYNGTEELALVTDSDGTLRIGTGNGTDTLYQNIYWDDTTEKWYSDSQLTTEVEPSGSLTSWQSIETIGDVKHYTNAVFTEILFTGIVPIMCRDEDTDLTDNALLKWNSTNRVARTIASPTTDGQILTYKYTPQTTTTVYTDGTDFYNADGSSAIEPSGTSGTPTLIGEFVLYNDLWYSKDTDWYLVDDFTDNTDWTLVTDQNTIDALELETPIEISSVVYTVAEINTYEWKLSNSAGVSFIGTRAEYNVAKLIPLGTVGHIPSGSLVILTDETDYLNSEDR